MSKFKSSLIIIFTFFSLSWTTIAFSEELPVEFLAGYNFADTFNITDDGMFTRAGRLTGSWQWKFENGEAINSRFVSATIVRTNPRMLHGTIQFSMPNKEHLYLGYWGISYEKRVSTIEADILGGTGRWKGARGHLKWSAYNGIIEDGRGLIITCEEGGCANAWQKEK